VTKTNSENSKETLENAVTKPIWELKRYNTSRKSQPGYEYS
jgi:hypothetical protein